MNKAGKIHILNALYLLVTLKQHEHVGQVCNTFSLEPPPSSLVVHFSPVTHTRPTGLNSFPISLSPNIVRLFNQLYECFDEVFNLEFPDYNRAIVNMGPVLPPQKKGHVLLYSYDKLSELQEHFDTLE